MQYTTACFCFSFTDFGGPIRIRAGWISENHALTFDNRVMILPSGEITTIDHLAYFFRRSWYWSARS
jgi:hypothetical protein